MLEAGLKISINSDDPAYFGGYVGDNYLHTARALALTESDLRQIASNSLASALA
jgi:adenosine deaminase